MLQGEHSAILLTVIQLQFVIKVFVLSIFKWPLETGFTVVILVYVPANICHLRNSYVLFSAKNNLVHVFKNMLHVCCVYVNFVLYLS